MAWNIESTETVKVEDPDPAIWARAAENALRQGSIDESIRNIDKALYYSNYSIHYKFEKVKILCATNRFIPCMQLLRENMHAFKNDYINQNKNIQLKEVLNSVANYLVLTVENLYESKQYFECMQQAKHVLEQDSDFLHSHNKTKIITFWRSACDAIIQNLYDNQCYDSCVNSINDILTNQRRLTSFLQRNRFAKLSAKSFYKMKLYRQSMREFISLLQVKLATITIALCLATFVTVIFLQNVPDETCFLSDNIEPNLIIVNNTTQIKTELKISRPLGSHKLEVKGYSENPDLAMFVNNTASINTNFLGNWQGPVVFSLKGLEAGSAEITIIVDDTPIKTFKVMVVPSNKSKPVARPSQAGSYSSIPVPKEATPALPLGQNATTAAAAIPAANAARPVPKAVIVGNEVILRSRPEIDSSEIGLMNHGDRVDVMEKWKAKSSNKAILSRSDLFVEMNGKKIELQKGQAVLILKELRDTYRVKIMLGGKWIELNAKKDHITKLKNDEWFKIRLQEGTIGWVLGRFVKE